MRGSSFPPGSTFNGQVMLGVSLLIVVSFASAQTPETADLRAFFDAVEVSLVNVHMNVTNADGQMVADLVLTGFELLDGARPVRIGRLTTNNR